MGIGLQTVLGSGAFSKQDLGWHRILLQVALDKQPGLAVAKIFVAPLKTCLGASALVSQGPQPMCYNVCLNRLTPF